MGQEHPIKLSKSLRSRRFKGVIRDGVPVLVIPKRATSTQTKEVLISLEDWFLKAVERVESEKAVIGDDSILFLGREIPIIVNPSLGAEALLGRAGLEARADSPEGAREIALSWLYRQAEVRIHHAVDLRSAQMGLVCREVRILETSSRWGSCAPGGRLGFCWRQIMAPPEVIDYLAVHELAHLQERNHGPRYWALVAKHMPEFERWDRWLSRKGSILMHLYPRQKLASLRKLKRLPQAVSVDDLASFRLVFGSEDEF